MHPSGGEWFIQSAKTHSPPQTSPAFCCQCQMKQHQRPVEITWYPYHDLPCARACMLTGWTPSPGSTHPTSHEAGPHREMERPVAPHHKQLSCPWEEGVWTCQETEVLVIRSKSNHQNQLIYPETQVRFFFYFQSKARFWKSKIIWRTKVLHVLCHWIEILPLNLLTDIKLES